MRRPLLWKGSLALTLLLLAGSVLAAATIAVGPYVQNVSTDNATICWATLDGQVTCTAAGAETMTGMAYTCHSVLLQDLEPGTTYSYDVLKDGTGAGKGSFTTVPEGEHAFSFSILGDTQGTENPAHQAAVQAVLAEKPDLVFNTGDLVSDGRDSSHWADFFQVNAELMRSIPYYPALGNHDRHSSLYFNFFALPGNEAYYSFDRGAAHFVCLDSPGLPDPETNQPLTKEEHQRLDQARAQYWQSQLAWLKEDLAAHSDAKYVFVLFHYPPYSVLKNRVEGLTAFRATFGTIFQDYRVSAVFNGHDHHFHHALAGGVHFVTEGVGSGRPRATDGAPLPESVKYAQVSGHMNVKVDANQATVRVIGMDGTVVDSFDLKPRVMQ